MSDSAFEAPETDGGADDFDPAAAVPGVVVRIAGGALIVAGCFVAASGLQLWTFFVIYSLWLKIVATLMVLGGLAALPLGGFFYQARSWAVLLSIPLAGGLALGATGWLLYSLLAGMFSPIMLFASGFSMLAALLVVVGTPGALKAAAARKALYR